MHRTANTGPSSMMAAAVVTAATCAQEEKIQKHITPTNTEHSIQKKKLCEMATQTITITSIFTNLNSSSYNQIPYVDQYVPNNNQNEVTDKEHHNHNDGATTTTTSATSITRVGIGTNDDEMALTVANNNKINQQHHHHPHHHNTNHMNAVVPVTATAIPTATTTITSDRMIMSTTINGIVCATTTPLNVGTFGNHIAAVAANAAPTTTTSLHNESTGCIKSNTVLTTSL